MVAFGSAPGVPNWAGVLGRLRASGGGGGGGGGGVGRGGGGALPPEAAARVEVLYVVDPARGWFSEPWSEPPEGGWEAALRAACAPFGRVLLLGDSMGASAALRYSDLASGVLAFCPQVDLASASIRPGGAPGELAAFEGAVRAALARSEAAVRVHTGSWEGDLAQVARLGEHPRLEVTAHDVDGHRVTARLNAEDALLDILRGAVEAEVAALPRAPAP